MKLINLNIWGGKIHDPLIEFLRKHKSNTDFFTLQEVFKSDRSVVTPKDGHSNILEELKNEFSEFDFLFSPTYHNRDFEYKVNYPLFSGLGIFWKKSFVPKKVGTIFTHYSENEVKAFQGSDKPDVPRNFQYLIFNNFLLMNFHGYWAPLAKIDTPERLEQSEKLINFIKENNLPTVLAGDFNLGMDTKSVAMFEENGFRNLVKESKALTTRTNYYDIKWRRNDKFVDYIFASPEIKVKSFEVMKDEVSDHLSLLFEFDL